MGARKSEAWPGFLYDRALLVLVCPAQARRSAMHPNTCVCVCRAMEVWACSAPGAQMSCVRRWSWDVVTMPEAGTATDKAAMPTLPAMSMLASTFVRLQCSCQLWGNVYWNAPPGGDPGGETHDDHPAMSSEYACMRSSWACRSSYRTRCLRTRAPGAALDVCLELSPRDGAAERLGHLY